MTRLSILFPHGSTADRFDLVIEVLLSALLVFSPLAFGATEAWSEQVVVALAAAMCLVFVSRQLLFPQIALVRTWVYVPVALFLLLVAAQLLPAPAELVGRLSPAARELRVGLGTDTPRQTLSLYPAATAQELRLVLSVVAVFVVVLNVYRRRDQVVRLLATVTAVGALVAGIALYQNLTGSRTVYGSTPAIHPFSGPFMNHSHFSQFMNLSVGAALGLFLLRLDELTRRSAGRGASLGEHLRGSQLGLYWLAPAAAMVCSLAMLLSMSRGGVLSLVAAAALTGLALALSRGPRGRASLMLAFGIVVLAVLVYAGFDRTYDRIASLRHVDAADAGRSEILRDLTVAWKAFPVLGTGLGTFQTVFPMLDKSRIRERATHAENEYAQLLTETGVVGLALVALFLGIVAVNYVRTVRRPQTAVHACAFGLGLGVIAICIHSLSDFGQHVPAVACLTAVATALVIRLPRLDQEIHASQSPVASYRWRLPLRAATLVAVVCVSVWGLSGAERARAAAGIWSQVDADASRLADARWQGDDEAYASLIRNASAAAAIEPDNITYRYSLNVYRWHAISRATDPRTGDLLIFPSTLEFTSRIVQDLHELRALCPTYGPAVSLAGKLEYFVLGSVAGATHIEAGARLSNTDADVCLAAGELCVRRGDVDRGSPLLARAVELNAGMREQVIRLYVRDAARMDLALSAAGNDRRAMNFLAGLLQGDASQAGVAARLRTEAHDLLVSEAARPDAPAQTVAELANWYVGEKEYGKAAEGFRRALASDYGQVDWRLSLASALADGGETGEAVREARVCLRLRPGYQPAKSLVERLTSRPRGRAT